MFHDRLVNLPRCRKESRSRERRLGFSRHSRSGSRALREPRRRCSGWRVRGVVPRSLTGSGPRRAGTRGAEHSGLRLSADPFRSRHPRPASRCPERTRNLHFLRTRMVETREWLLARCSGGRGISGTHHDGPESPLPARPWIKVHRYRRPHHDELAPNSA